MVRTAGSTLRLLLLVLAVLPDCPRAADCPLLRGDDHSVYYDFNISSKKQPWCMAQGQMDGKDFFSYDCGNDKVISMNLLREEVMATETWKEQTTKLCDLGKSIKDHLHDIKPANHTGPFTLQARMTCHCNASGNYNGSWAFGWNGQRVLLFDSKSGKYTVDHSRGEQMKEKWEKFKKLTQEFEITLKGDCKKWLQHLVSWKKELETTGAPFTAPATATPSTVSAAPAKTTAKTIASIVFGALGVLIFGFIGLGWFYWYNSLPSRRPYSGLVRLATQVAAKWRQNRDLSTGELEAQKEEMLLHEVRTLRSESKPGWETTTSPGIPRKKPAAEGD